MDMDPNDLGPNVYPEVMDVEWKLDALPNTRGVALDNRRYTVVLQMDGEDVRFTCTSQQLQDLVYKLKDLVRHCVESVNEELAERRNN